MERENAESCLGSGAEKRRITGFHAIEAFVRRGAGGGSVLYAALKTKRTLALTEAARAAGIPVRWTDTRFLDTLCPHGEHRGLVLELQAAHPEARGLSGFLSGFTAEKGLVLVLDGITDVHNLGAIVRSADLFSVDAVLIPSRHSAKDSGVVAKVSSGASAFVPLMETPNLTRALLALKDAGFWVYGADMAGESAAETRFAERAVLVLGSEGAGLSSLVKENCDALVKIPSSGHVDSFNVSVAAGILMYEIRRQQGFSGL